MTRRARAALRTYERQMPKARAVFSREGEADVLARARIVGFSEDEIASGIQEGGRKMIVFAPDITWPDPLREGDTVRFDGQDLYVNVVDDQKRRIDGVLIAYEVEASGR